MTKKEIILQLIASNFINKEDDNLIISNQALNFDVNEGKRWSTATYKGSDSSYNCSSDIDVSNYNYVFFVGHLRGIMCFALTKDNSSYRSIGTESGNDPQSSKGILQRSFIDVSNYDKLRITWSANRTTPSFFPVTKGTIIYE